MHSRMFWTHNKNIGIMNKLVVTERVGVQSSRARLASRWTFQIDRLTQLACPFTNQCVEDEIAWKIIINEKIYHLLKVATPMRNDYRERDRC